jgi:hypothetical protein
MRVAGAPGDGAGVNVAVVDVPAILAVGRSAAGKGGFGHAAIEAPDPAQGKPQPRWCLQISGLIMCRPFIRSPAPLSTLGIADCLSEPRPQPRSGNRRSAFSGGGKKGRHDLPFISSREHGLESDGGCRQWRF